MSKKIEEITLDFTGVKTLWELHERIRIAFRQRTLFSHSFEKNRALVRNL